jgi:hypothetical protein
MRIVIGRLTSLGAVAALVAVTGCSSIPVQTRQNVAAPLYPPTNPAAVQILREAPTQPNVKLGQIATEPQSSSTPLAEVEAKLREAGAKLGAHAVVIVVETKFTAATVTNGWWDAQRSPDLGQVFIGVPIRYTSQELARSVSKGLRR